jgi:hypothetical protein
VRSSNPSKLLVSAVGSSPGSASATSAGEYGTATAKVMLLLSGFVFRTTEVRASAVNQTGVSVVPAVIDSATGNPVPRQTLRQGAEPVQIRVTNSNPETVGLAEPAIEVRPDSAPQVSLHLFRPGQAVIRLGTAPGFTTPAGGTEVTVVADSRRILLNSSGPVGKDLQGSAGAS